MQHLLTTHSMGAHTCTDQRLTKRSIHPCCPFPTTSRDTFIPQTVEGSLHLQSTWLHAFGICSLLECWVWDIAFYQPGVRAAKASCIFWRQWAYFCRICRVCSSSSRCRIRRKFCNSGMLKASHCKKQENGSNYHNVFIS